uniref:DNA-directed RNA polymerase n=1 Tax=viral metagenome TaxID=1070528 RepID=A0A6C0DBE5_9ZZZZ
MEDSLAAEGLRFLEKYFQETDFPLTRHHIDSYEKCIFDEIPTIIHSNNPIVFLKEPLDKEAGVFAYRVEIFVGGDAPTPAGLALSLSPPVVTLDEGNTIRRLLPNEARLRGLTYSAQISADILVRVTFTRSGSGSAAGAGAGAGAGSAAGESTEWVTEVKEAPLIRGFPLFRIPILLRSRLCATGVSDPARLEEMGECRNDYGGYFIIDGAEKVLITRGEQAFNSLYVERKPESDPLHAYASVVSLHPETKQTRRIAMYMLKKTKTNPGEEIRVAVPMIRGAFPLFMLFRALGLESDEEIVRMIFPDPADPLAAELIPSIEDAYPIHNKYLAIQYIKTLTKGFTEAHVLDILQNLMLPHVPDEPMNRAYYLADMARQIIYAKHGLQDKTDRDDMRGQRFLTSGVLVRELFNACWKEWRAAVILTIDRTYRANEQLYQGSSVFDLFAQGNLMTMFQPQTLNSSILRGFKGRWGTNERNEKPGVLQALARISYMDSTSHQRRVVSDFDTGMKTTGPRKLQTSHIGFFCTSETPTGAHIGVTKNLSMMTQFSFGAPTGPLLAWMRIKGGLIPVAETTPELRRTAAVVQINGGTVGFTLTPQSLVQTLRLFKWNALIAPTASISFNTPDRTVRIYLDEGRPVRPLWHLVGGSLRGPQFLELLPTFRDMPWRNLVFGTHPATAAATLRTVTFLDPLAENPRATAEDYAAALSPTAGFIEYCDPNEMNEAYISWWGSIGDLTPEHTHVEIHPSTMTGLLASMIPYSNHNQAPRNQLSNSQSKQGIGYMATNLLSRYDNNAHQLCYGEAPICRTFMYETVGRGEMPYGFNCIIAATSESGYNQDDGLIINKDSVARGMFQSINLRSYDCEEETDPRTKAHSHVANPAAVPAWTSLASGLDYSKLDERGIIREGEMVDEKTVLVGRYLVLPDTNEIKDYSVKPALWTQGRVDSVVVLHQGNGHLLVKVRIIEIRVPQLGDKFSSRHGQKGTIGMFVAAADMPRLADGTVPDVMVNPGGLISRMTVAQLVEMIAGRLGAEVSAKVNATTFSTGGNYVTQLGDALEAAGLSRAGDSVMYSGVSGKQLACDIFVCPLYFMRLRHLTEDKVNARGMGKKEVKTHQPTGGRGNEGGLRIGEMERDSLCAHGIAGFLQESMMKRGDATKFWICNGCGRIPIYNEGEKLFVCPGCDGPLTYTGLDAATMTLQMPLRQSRATFSQVSMPYTLKLMEQELATFGGYGIRFVTESSVGRLREEGWGWMRVEDGGGAGAGAATGVAAGAGAGEEGDAGEAGEAEEAGKEAEVGPKPLADTTVADLPVAAAGAGAEAADKAVIADTQTIRFSTQMDNEWGVFSNFAIAPMRMPAEQIPAPDGTQYPALGINPDGSVDPAKQTWPTVAHYFLAMKFPADPAIQEQIRQAPTAAKAKSISQSKELPLRGDWEAIKDRVMKSALVAKFRQNPSALYLLQSTGERHLLNVSPADAYWGSGKNGKGENRLGALLEEVRTELAGERPDEKTFQRAALNRLWAESDESDDEEAEAAAAEAAAAEAVAAAKDTVQVVVPPAQAAATNATATNATATNAAPAVQSGGVYLFINPQAAPAMKNKERRYRNRGGNRRLTWEGIQTNEGTFGNVTQAGGSFGDDGGNDRDTSEKMTTQSGGNLEVQVTKEG